MLVFNTVWICVSLLSIVWGNNYTVGLLFGRWTAVPEGVFGLLAQSYSRWVGSAMVECTVQKEAAALHHAPLPVPLLEMESWRKTPTAQVWGSLIVFDQHMHLQFVHFYLRFYCLWHCLDLRLLVFFHFWASGCAPLDSLGCQYHQGALSMRVSRKGQVVSALEADWLELTAAYYRKGWSLVDSFIYWDTPKGKFYVRPKQKTNTCTVSI